MKKIMLVKNFCLSENKGLEIQLDIFPEDDSTIFQCETRIDQKTDHAGAGFFLYIYKTVYFHIQIYDKRHWDYKNKRWETGNEDSENQEGNPS